MAAGPMRRQEDSSHLSACLATEVLLHTLYFVALTSRDAQSVVYFCYTNIGIALPLYFFSFVFSLFHYYFCCILL